MSRFPISQIEKMTQETIGISKFNKSEKRNTNNPKHFLLEKLQYKNFKIPFTSSKHFKVFHQASRLLKIHDQKRKCTK